MDCGVAFCHSGCPLGNLIPEWNEFVARGDWAGASERLHATNNFPEFTGWICPAPCEAACVLALNTDPVTIKQVEVSIVEQRVRDGLVEPQPPLERTGQPRRRRRLGPGRPGRRPAADPGRARRHRVRARRPPRRAAALRHPGLQDAQGHHRPAARRRCAAEGTDVPRQHRHRPRRRRRGCARTSTRSSSPSARSRRASSTNPGRDLAGVHQAMEYLPQGNRVQAGDLDRAAASTPPAST